jgi:putative transposase
MTNHVHLIAIPGAPESLARTLGNAHSQYSLEQNRDRNRVGHLWHNRYFSCTLDPAHLLAAMRYVDLNPVRAGITAEARDWRWSSALAHTSPTPHDELLDWPWMEWMEGARLGRWIYSDWRSSLLAAERPEELDRMRRATHLGEPLGSEEFVQELEAKAGRRLRVGTPGRPHAAKAAAAGANNGV